MKSESGTAPPRLNGIIAALEAGRPAVTTFASAETESAIAMSQSSYDGVIFEMEHGSWDGTRLRDGLQYMLNRRQLVEGGTLAPRVTPMVRIPANGVEKNQWLAKQALDLGCYGIVWPHISTVDEARNAVAACRYPRLKTAPIPEPMGIRGDGPTAAARYWGLDQYGYYARADVWPLAPHGEILVIIQIEDMAGIDNLDAILSEVPGIGVVLIGEGDLSQELGFPRQYEHPQVLTQMSRVVEACARHGVVVGHPHVSARNAERVLSEGYRFLMASPSRSYADLEAVRASAKL